VVGDRTDTFASDSSARFLASLKPSASERLRVTSLPERSLALWTDFLKSKTLLDGGAPSRQGEHKRDSKPRAQKRRKQVSEVETVDLEKEAKKENPVTHSFEKMETADDYQGGYRHADGEDQIEDHQDALDEVDLKHVTRGGEAAQSVFEADISHLVETPIVNGDADPRSGVISLPEWDWRREQLLPNYCRLQILKTIETAQTSNSDTPLRWYNALIEKQDGVLLQWKHRLESLVNQRSWKDRQWEGSDISIDAYVRYLSDCCHGHQGDARLYLRSVRSSREFSTFVLLDQSLSTDSWVMNRRVLDVELESIALMSFLLRELDEPFAVGGTYSHTRHHCSLNIYKDFSDPWDSFLIQAPKIEPTGYTRLGPSIRHATDLLVEEGGRQKLLILLTDGKPTDYDRYEGRYGIEDIRHANLEAKQKGVQVRALAVESVAKDYFPHLFGKKEYQIIQDPTKLPEALFKIFLESIRS
jgi:nitric oxide reductase NorD protein